MKPIECRLEQRKGNWVKVTAKGAFPATHTELYLWLALQEARKETPAPPPKLDRDQVVQAVKKMAAKAQELGWSPGMSREEARAAADNPKFVSVKLSEDQPKDGFILDWQCEKVGFGQITFYTKGRKLLCDTETMGPEFVRAALLHFLEKSVAYDRR